MLLLGTGFLGILKLGVEARFVALSDDNDEVDISVFEKRGSIDDNDLIRLVEGRSPRL